MSDPTVWRYGQVSFPLPSSTANSLLQDADPAIYWTLQYFQSVITSYTETRLLAQCALSPAIAIPKAVMYAVPYDPAPYLTELQAKFPLLAVYRVSDKFEDKTIAWIHRMSTWRVQYILPPLNAGQMERVGAPHLAAVGMVLHNRIEEIQDANFQSDTLVWQNAGIESIWLGQGTFGRYEGGQGLTFPSWSCTIDVKERLSYQAGQLQSFGGVDVTVDQASPAGPPVTAFNQATVTFQDPTTLPGLLAVYRPDSGITLDADGVHVTSIADSFTSGTTLSQGTFAAKPYLALGAVTDFVGTKKPVLRCDVGQYLVGTVAAMANDGGKTIVALARTSSTTGRQVLAAQTKSGDTGATSITLEANPPGSAGRFGFTAQSTNYDNAEAQPDTQWHVHAISVTGTTNGSSIASSTTYTLDGASENVATLSGTGNWTGMSTANQIAIGALPVSAATTSWIGDIGPVLVFNASVTSATLQAAVQYCKQWAGIL